MNASRPLPANNPEALQDDIERTRQELASTVDELTAKLDVRARAKHGLQDAARGYGVAVLAGLGVVVVLLVVRRRRAHRQ